MSRPPEQRRGLGRGLSALMADIDLASPADNAGDARQSSDRLVPIERIRPNPDQPRRIFDPEALEDLANSVRTKGVLQPLLVRPTDEEGVFEIVAGERRWRAAQMAQLHELPVLVRDYDDTEILEVAIIENIQRADLSAIEEAQGFRQLMDRFGHTQEKMAEALGKSRSHIANCLRLLTLPPSVQTLVSDGVLSAGHARALVTADDPERLAKIVSVKGLSVRDTEKLAKEAAGPKSAQRTRQAREKDADTRALEADLSATLRMGVVINHDASGEGGTVTIRYANLDQLDDLCRQLAGSY